MARAPTSTARMQFDLPLLSNSYYDIFHPLSAPTARDINSARSVTVPTPSVNLTADTSSDSDLGASLPAGGAVTVSRTLNMPVGVLQNFGFQAGKNRITPNVCCETLLYAAGLKQRPYIIETMHSYIHCLCNAYLGCTYPC